MQGPIAYVTSQYPRATDTFIQREVLSIRSMGIDVLTCSIRRTASEHHVGPEQQAEARSTFCVLSNVANPLTLIKAHLSIFFKSPIRYLKATLLSLQTAQPGIRGAAFQLVYFAEAAVLGCFLAKHKVKHLHNHIAESSCTVAMLASTMIGIPFSFTMHGPGIFFAPQQWRIDKKIANSSFTVCISHFCRSQGMIFADPAHWPKMHIVHCGVDPMLYDRPRPKPGKKLLFVGRLAGVKGVPVLLEALTTLRDLHPDLRLTLVGDGPERAVLEAKAQVLGVADLVDFVGYKSQDEVAEHLAQSDIFVLPSFAEGLPVVLMEALASRVPVVTTRIAGVAELVEDGVNGYLVPPGDVASLTDRLEQLLANPDTRTAMGEAGRARVMEEFNIRTETARLAGLLRSYHQGTPPQKIRAPLPD